MYGLVFKLITDHKPLTTILGRKIGFPVLTASRLQHWAIQLSSYQFDIKYHATRKHQNNDTQSHFSKANVGQESRTLFDRETKQIHKIQVKKITCDCGQSGCGNKE